MILNKLKSASPLLYKTANISPRKLLMSPARLQRLLVRSCSTTVEKMPLNVTEEKNSWSYEFDETIKGISYSDATGNYIIIYTCKVCETRQSRSFTKNAYHNGVVIVRCEGCEKLHLIADNMKWFEDDKVNVEDLVRRENAEVIKIEAKGELKEYLLNKLKKREPEIADK